MFKIQIIYTLKDANIMFLSLHPKNRKEIRKFAL